MPFPTFQPPAQVAFDAHIPFDAHVPFDGRAVDWPGILWEVAWQCGPYEGEPSDTFWLIDGSLPQPDGTFLRRTSSGAPWKQNAEWVYDGTGKARLNTCANLSVINEDFRRTPAGLSNLGGSSEPNGHAWTADAGTPQVLVTTIAENSGATADAALSTTSAASLNGLWPDGDLFVLLTKAAGSSSAEIRFRMIDVNNYMSVTLSAGNNILLDKVVAGVRTNLATVAVTAGGTAYAYHIRANGKRIRVYYWRTATTMNPAGTNNWSAAWDEHDVLKVDYTMTAGEYTTFGAATRVGYSNVSHFSDRSTQPTWAFMYVADVDSYALVDGCSAGTITGAISVAENDMGYVFRYVNARNFWRVVCTATGLTLIKRVNNVDTVVANYVGTTAGVLTITLNGANKTITLDAATIFNDNDAANQTGYLCGLIGRHSGGVGRLGPITVALRWEQIPTTDTRGDGMSISRGIPYNIGSLDPAKATVQLHNRPRKYDPANTASTLYAYLKRWKQIRCRYQLADSPLVMFQGYIDRYPQDWGVKGIDIQVPLELIDAAALGRLTLMRSPYVDMVKICDPSTYLRYASRNPSDAVLDESLNLAGTMGGLTPAVQTDQILNGDGGVGWTQPQTSASSLTMWPLGRFSWSFDFPWWVNWTGAVTGVFFDMWTVDITGNQPNVDRIRCEFTNHQTVQITIGRSNGLSQVITGTVTNNAGVNRHHVYFHADGPSGTYRLLLDGVVAASGNLTGMAISFDSFAGWTSGASALGANHNAADFAFYPRIFTDAEVAARADASNVQTVNDTADRRTHRVLDSLPGTSRRTLPICTKPLLHATIDGIDTLDDVANGERGYTIVAIDGRYRLRPCAEFAAQQVAWDWGNAQGVARGAAQSPQFEVLPILSVVEVTRTGAGTRGKQSAALINAEQLTIPTLLLNDSDVDQLMLDVLTARAGETLLVRQVIVQPRKDDQWKIILGLELLTYVRFMAIPLAAPTSPVLSIAAYVTKIDHQVQRPDWTATLEVMLP